LRILYSIQLEIIKKSKSLVETASNKIRIEIERDAVTDIPQFNIRELLVNKVMD
jgi:hypothetical protein